VDIGSHALDLIDFLLGPLDRVRASATGPAGHVETKVEMHFRVGNGIDGTATWSFEASEAEDLLIISGSEGSVRVPSAMNGRELVWADGVETYDAPDPVQGPLVETVVNAILDGADCPSTASSSKRTSRVIDDALGHYYGGRSDAFWSRPETWAAS
jgi:predicted dehydrogenase